MNIAGGFGTALQLAVRGKDNLAFVDLLLENGADVNAPAPEPQGRTALQAAVEFGDRNVIELLLNHRANVNAAPSSEGVTAMQAAAWRGDTLLVAKLIQRGADVNAPAAAEYGQTALQAAVRKGHLGTVDLLLHEGANFLATPAPTGGFSVLEAAMSQPLALNMIMIHAKAQGTVTTLGNQVAVLLSAIDDDSYSEVTALLLKYDIQSSSSDLQHPLETAITKGNVDLAKRKMDRCRCRSADVLKRSTRRFNHGCCGCNRLTGFMCAAHQVSSRPGGRPRYTGASGRRIKQRPAHIGISAIQRRKPKLGNLL